MAAPSFDGHEVSRNSDPRNAVWSAGGVDRGGRTAPLYAPIATTPPLLNPNAAGLADNLHGTWLHVGPEDGSPGHWAQQQHHQFLPFRGQGADMAGGRFSGGRFSPPEGEAAPFRNW